MPEIERAPTRPTSTGGKQKGKGGRKKGGGRTKRRSIKIKTYYEMTYPKRKLRRIFRETGKTSLMKKWADAYKTPSGMSGAGALVLVARELGIKM